MTAFSASNLPASVNTLEKLALWVGMALNQVNLSVTAIEGDGAPQRVAQFGLYGVSNNNTTRALIRISLQIPNNFGASGSKLWASAQEISSTALPAEFTS